MGVSFTFMKWIPILILLFSFGGCKKEQEQKWRVNYRVIAYSLSSFEYRLAYQTPSGSTVTKGPISEYLWVSDTLEFTSGSQLFMEFSNVRSDTDADLQILINGQVHEEKAKKTGENTVSLSYQL